MKILLFIKCTKLHILIFKQKLLHFSTRANFHVFSTTKSGEKFETFELWSIPNFITEAYAFKSKRFASSIGMVKAEVFLSYMRYINVFLMVLGQCQCFKAYSHEKKTIFNTDNFELYCIIYFFNIVAFTHDFNVQFQLFYFLFI